MNSSLRRSSNLDISLILLSSLSARINYNGEYNASIYEFVDEPEIDGFSEIECRIALIETADTLFPDSGSAIKWCFDKLDS